MATIERQGPYRASAPPANEPLEEVAVHSPRGHKQTLLTPSFPFGVEVKAHAGPGLKRVYGQPMTDSGYVLHVGCKSKRAPTRNLDVYIPSGTTAVCSICGERLLVEGKDRGPT